MTHAYKKSQEAQQKKKALNVVDKELVSLKIVQKENAARIKELKATKADIALTKHGKTKAESSSSGRVTGVSRRTKKVVSSGLAKVIPEEIEAGSSGRVSVSFAQVELARRRAQVGSSGEVIESYSDGTFSLVLSHHLLTEFLHSGKA
jgi:hypothetical protein